MIEKLGTENFSVSSDEGGLLPLARSKKGLGRDDFLTLLVAQLRHQDPLNPLDSAQFTAQLAAFSSLEQLFNVNENLEELKHSDEKAVRLQTLGILGKEIVARGDVLSLKERAAAKGRFTLDSPADCSIRITDSNGYPIRHIKLGTLSPGEHTFQWDGRDDAGIRQSQGLYGYQVTAVDEGGQVLDVEPRIIGRVTGINLEDPSPLLYVDDIPISIGNVLDVMVTEEQIP
ncbi:MAG: flagellar hook assembly protein FlgD [Deltaproteobacteria bacterium]|nr:flagellar hook assembly protein FlgD [Deltaproteobacteria bacterium]